MLIQEPQDTHRLFADAASRGSLESLLALYEPDAVVVEKDGALSVGTEAIRAHLEQLLALEPRMRIEASWAVQHDDIALLCSRWTAEIRTPDGRTTTVQSRGSEIVRRQRDGTWKLAVDNPWGIDADVRSARAVGG
jgi:uncharacterized protein (TIGR02246 family)